jgi:LAO/AO transport system kinase
MKEQKKGFSISKGVNQPDSINPKLKDKKSTKAHTEFEVEDYLKGIERFDINMLGRAITLIESSLSHHQVKAQEIIKRCLPKSGKSVRIGITGVPGVGKSTFIEALGSMLVENGRRVAVLAVDPSSSLTKGSILGDKTRMTNLSAMENVFIRPSPSSGTLGGVARKTRETIIVCEAAGFDTILVETVGVGQSETTVHSMVDFFLMLALTGAGDELQGIKRGIMELVDMIVINKADDNTNERIASAKRTFENALHLYPAPKSGWSPKVESCSSLRMTGIENVWNRIIEYKNFVHSNNYFTIRRTEQAKYWFYETINSELMNNFYNNPYVNESLKDYENKLSRDEMSPFVAAIEVLDKYRNL